MDNQQDDRQAMPESPMIDQGPMFDAAGNEIVPAAGIAIEPDPLDDAQSKDIDDPGVDFAGAVWKVSPYFNARTKKVNMVLIHDTEGRYQPSIDWLCSTRPANQQSSAHYIFRSSDGHLTQMVREDKTAWHSGNWDINQRSVGIEHEGFVKEPEKWYTDVMLRASAKLCAAICQRYSIPIDRDHIIGHSEVPNPNNPGKKGGSSGHTDPGPGWPWDKYMQMVREETGQVQPAIPPPVNRQTQPEPAEPQPVQNGRTDYAVYGPATMSMETWINALRTNSSPAIDEAAECYQICLDNGVNPAVALAFFALETNYGNAPNAAGRKNWGNLSDGSGGLRSYDLWALGLRDWCTHFQQGVYAERDLQTIGKIIPTYQPSSTGRTAAGYATYVGKLQDLIDSWKS